MLLAQRQKGTVCCVLRAASCMLPDRTGRDLRPLFGHFRRMLSRGSQLFTAWNGQERGPSLSESVFVTRTGRLVCVAQAGPVADQVRVRVQVLLSSPGGLQPNQRGEMSDRIASRTAHRAAGTDVGPMALGLDEWALCGWTGGVVTAILCIVIVLHRLVVVIVVVVDVACRSMAWHGMARKLTS